jgi:ABC-type Fe3+ transport system permease subunit
MSRGNFFLASFLWLVIAFLVIFPLSILMLESFKIAETGGWGLGNYLEFFKDTYYLKTFGNTLLLSTLVLLTTTVFGVPLAYILARYRQRGKTVFTALPSCRLFCPPLLAYSLSSSFSANTAR